MVTVEDVREALMDVYDPELNYNIVDLGLVYDINVEEEGRVNVLMTLTTPMCPIGPMVQEQISEKLSLYPAVREVNVEFTFDPPWNPSRMTDEARFALGVD